MGDTTPAADLELVVDDLSFPTSVAFDDGGRVYVAESGLPFGGARPGGRVWALDEDGRRCLLAEGLRPPVNGVVWHDGALFVSEGGHPQRMSHVARDGSRTTVLEGLPGPGNYQLNMVAVGPDGKLYFSQGAMTNTAIVGLDAYELGWLGRLPHAHDVPGYDVVLHGVNVDTDDPLADVAGTRTSTGAFSPFGTPTKPGQVVPGDVPATAAVMRCNPDGSDLELVAWGLRNAYGLRFLDDGACWRSTRAQTTAAAALLVTSPTCSLRSSTGRGTGGPTSSAAIPSPTSGTVPREGRRRRSCSPTTTSCRGHSGRSPCSPRTRRPRSSTSHPSGRPRGEGTCSRRCSATKHP